ncbi:Ribose ABC transport system, permease protein RbsC [Paenibacillus pasadenensis]|uniref:Ribose ABC transport system, permease protein RbsC n=1 Tax=Paenibacillus pasadenensis TaxID=217090 RepID=A0A2N5N5Q8_9BACL|nr:MULTISPECIES: ABC transporter permease [Paenibacillus]PLT45643.1 Ribose ABC transport system, permease protein RbsC [Paenibacillus pasadenensis]QGG56091.1 ABC transporter permease [Paenibacillus sp. B01]
MRANAKLTDFIFKYGSLIVIGLVILFFSLWDEHFFTYDNLASILRSISITAFVAIGVTFSLSVDGFDLSVGSTVSMVIAFSTALMVWYEMPLAVVIIGSLAIGAAVGLVNSLLIVLIRIPDLLATLAIMYVVSGLQQIFTKGNSIYSNMIMPDGSSAPGTISPAFLWLGQGELLGVPVPVALMIVAFVLVFVFFTYTRMGRQMEMTGGNEEAARLSGVRVRRIRTTAYVLSGLFAAVGGLLFAARTGSGQSGAGAPILMEAVAAVFVGYSVLGAGRPNIIGTFFGAVLIGVLLNGLTMMNVPYYSNDFIKGGVLVLALAITFIHLNRRKA